VERENEELPDMKKQTRNMIKWNREDGGQAGRRQVIFG
jgi:hypothetical protein